MEKINFLTLAVLGYIDYVRFKIPNVIICGWLGTFFIIKILSSSPTNFYTLITTLIASTLVTGSYFPLHHIVKCNAGDFKLFGVLTAINGLDDTLWIILITISFSVFPFAIGIKKIQIASYTFFGYIAFLFLRRGGIVWKK